MKETQRVKNMKKGFMGHHNNGKSVKQIAEIYGVTTRTIYQNLQQIAEENGVSREELLERVHSKHIVGAILTRKERVDIKSLEESFDNANKNMNSILDSIDKALDEDKYER